MVDRTPETLADIAARTGRALETVRRNWRKHPDWPAPIGHQSRAALYDPDAVDTWLAAHAKRPAVQLEAGRLYTAAEIHALGGPSPESINSEKSRGKWPPPDGKIGRANAWRGETVQGRLDTMHAYRTRRSERMNP
jgi:hypothetical protein